MTRHAVRIEDPKSGFSASHFLYDHRKCSRIHGHNYDVALEISGPLNDKHFVVDFYDLKQELKQITSVLDHKILLPTDSEHIAISEKGTQVSIQMGEKHYEFPNSDVVLLPIEATSAELLAKYLYDRLKPGYPSPEYSIIVEVAESYRSVAKYGDF